MRKTEHTLTAIKENVERVRGREEDKTEDRIGEVRRGLTMKNRAGRIYAILFWETRKIL